MSQSFQLDSNRLAELLHEAASRHAAVVVTCKLSDGWTTLKSRFLGIEPENQQLAIEYPSGSHGVSPEMVGGESIGISFRRGHKKYVFSTMVRGRCRFSLSGLRGIPALALRWPEEMCEFQRRLYYRAPVPEGTTIPVELWRGNGQDARSAEASTHRGTMLDLSVGGISVALPRDNSPRWHEDDPVSCSFPASSAGPPVTVDGRLRHCEKTADGRVQVGLHFIGLDSSPSQRDALQRVIRLAARFQRAGTGRATKRL